MKTRKVFSIKRYILFLAVILLGGYIQRRPTCLSIYQLKESNLLLALLDFPNNQFKFQLCGRMITNSLSNHRIQSTHWNYYKMVQWFTQPLFLLMLRPSSFLHGLKVATR